MDYPQQQILETKNAPRLTALPVAPDRNSSAVPKVSVLIPVFNGERYLAECLESVLAQDYADMEILIADDQSTDGSAAIIEKYSRRDPRIRFWRNSRRLGLVENSNACLCQARGAYVKFVHQDDLLLSASAIQKMALALDEHSTAVLVGSRQQLIGKKHPRILSETSRLFSGRQMIVVCLEQNCNLIGQPTLTMFRREAARRGFDESFVGHLDCEMWCHLLEKGDFYYLAEPLAAWRVHATQQTSKHQRNGEAHHEHLAFVETYYAKPWLKELATDRMLFAQIYYLRKKYGEQAAALTSAMKAQLTPARFLWQWVKHKTGTPFREMTRKLGRAIC